MFIGYGVAKTLFDIDEEPTTIYLRANPTFIEDVVEVLAPSMNPENPDQVEVTRPSDALEAQQAAEEAFTNLLLGLGSVALLVGGVAIANVMVMSVLERRMELVRPSNEQSKGFINKQEIRTFRTINWLEKNWVNYKKKISMDQIAIAVALEYTKFRFTDSWSKNCQKLNEWLPEINEVYKEIGEAREYKEAGILRELILDVGQDAVKKVTKTKKKQHMLEEQIRDYIPCDVEPKEEENENI
mgnify:CR=1 FL=1